MSKKNKKQDEFIQRTDEDADAPLLADSIRYPRADIS